MNLRYTWNETKRRKNLRKHGLDLRDGWKVLESRYRLEVGSARDHEPRQQVFAYVYGVLSVLSLVYVPDEDAIHFISLRRASRKEREVYYAWLDSEDVQP
ncbi:MAG: BrnT family toxin [Candidatus Methylumidiphilus alinenensis]|uniref:BrnT family toxin n=1 Tax=Candidatus Methylumidiphilus alinenensis TaxID=2202197 RepID=A0A2W4RF70_9GAMM|nr:MAG: BrnT family toxin [Candidatus Methylumidiphilus alinenensis]